MIARTLLVWLYANSSWTPASSPGPLQFEGDDRTPAAHAQEFLDAAPRVRALLLGWYLIQSQQNILSVRARNSMDVFVCLYKYAHSVLCVQQVL